MPFLTSANLIHRFVCSYLCVPYYTSQCHIILLAKMWLFWKSTPATPSHFSSFHVIFIYFCFVPQHSSSHLITYSYFNIAHYIDYIWVILGFSLSTCELCLDTSFDSSVFAGCQPRTFGWHFTWPWWATHFLLPFGVVPHIAHTFLHIILWVNSFL